MDSLRPFLQGTCTPYNMPVYPGAQWFVANSEVMVAVGTILTDRPLGGRR
jgi:hypothetical protein